MGRLAYLEFGDSAVECLTPGALITEIVDHHQRHTSIIEAPVVVGDHAVQVGCSDTERYEVVQLYAETLRQGGMADARVSGEPFEACRVQPQPVSLTPSTQPRGPPGRGRSPMDARTHPPPSLTLIGELGEQVTIVIGSGLA